MTLLNLRYFLLFIRFTSSVHLYSTRQSSFGNLYVTSVNTTQYGLRSLKFIGPHLWNSLPTNISLRADVFYFLCCTRKRDVCGVSNRVPESCCLGFKFRINYESLCAKQLNCDHLQHVVICSS